MANPWNLIRVIPAEESWSMPELRPPEGRAFAPGTHGAPDLGTQDLDVRDIVADRIVSVLAALRAKAPRIHAITSPVAQVLTANGLLALGAVPSLTVNAEEIEAFVRHSDAALLNLGMLDRDRIAALPIAARALGAAPIPFVLDPVFADRSAGRRALARTLLASRPGIVKLNRAEAAVFGRDLPAGAVEIVTGPVDCVRLGLKQARLANGHPRLRQVTGTGCLLGAILAGCLAVADDPFEAAIAGVSLLNIAAEIAAEGAAGPGTFAIGLIDALFGLDGAAIHGRLKLEHFSHDPA